MRYVSHSRAKCLPHTEQCGVDHRGTESRTREAANHKARAPRRCKISVTQQRSRVLAVRCRQPLGLIKVRRHRTQRSADIGVERLIEVAIYDGANETSLIVVDSSPVIEAFVSSKPREPFGADRAGA